MKNTFKDETVKQNTIERILTENGVTTLKNYLYLLFKYYYNTTKFPITIPPLYGLAYFNFAHNIRSREEIKSRIMFISQILCEQEWEVEVNGRVMKINLETM